MPVEPDQATFAQLQLYEGLLSAFEHRAEVLGLIASCPRPRDSGTPLAGVAGPESGQSDSVLDLPLARFTGESRDQVARRAAKLRGAIVR